MASGLTGAGDGARQLGTGLGELTGGSGELASSLQDGTDEVPSYGYGFAPYFMPLALWVGAMAYFLMRPAIRTDLVDRGGRGRFIALRSLARPAMMALVQSLLMVGIVVVGLDMQVANGWGLAGMALLTSLTFFAINQALIALLGHPGRFLAMVLVVLQLSAAGSAYPVETAPAFFQAIHPWLPMTYAVDSFRSLIAGGQIGIGHGIVVMGVWMAVAVALLALAVWVQRRKARTRSPLVLVEPAAAQNARDAGSGGITTVIEWRPCAVQHSPCGLTKITGAVVNGRREQGSSHH